MCRESDSRVYTDNNVFLCGYVGVAVSTSPGARVIHNTILGEGNYGIVIVADSDGEPYGVLHNLLYRTILGYQAGPQVWMMNAMG